MKQTITVKGVFPLERGGTLVGPEVALQTWGNWRPNAILICHALTGNQDADEWWSGLFGPGRLFDPSDTYIIAMNVLGGCSGTTGPESGERDVEFPRVTIRDMVRVQKAILDILDVTRLDLVIGGSMGGMQTLEWAALYPEFVDTIVPIGVGESQSAWAIGLSEAQRHAIVTDPKHNGGRYADSDPPVSGLGTARMIAMCSYRSPQSFGARFGRESDDDGFVVQSYLQHHATKLTERFDANSYLTLLDAMDSHDLGRDRSTASSALGRISSRCLAIGITSDVLYPVSEVRAMAAKIPNAQFSVLTSPNGHDAFLIDTDRLASIVTPFLNFRSPSFSPNAQGAAWA